MNICTVFWLHLYFIFIKIFWFVINQKIFNFLVYFSWYNVRLSLCFRLWFWEFSFKWSEIFFDKIRFPSSSVRKMFWYLPLFVSGTCPRLCSLQTLKRKSEHQQAAGQTELTRPGTGRAIYDSQGGHGSPTPPRRYKKITPL